MKRNRRTAPPGAKVSSIPEFLAKQLLRQFGFPAHFAPGEAEAECALLQREGIVDAVLSEDVDTLMFGAGISIRNWSPEGNSSKVPTHVTIYDASNIKEQYGLDGAGMVLVAMMSGGDYIPEGIPGCGPKIAVEAAKAGYGARLCQIKKRDTEALRHWKDDLKLELSTNQSKHFKRKHGALKIPEDWPSMEILRYYTHPAVSSIEKVATLRHSLQWDLEIDSFGLRSFAADAFDWQKLGGAKKFIRNLAPALLVRELRLRHERSKTAGEETEARETDEKQLVANIHGKRNHHTTDHSSELRVSFLPISLVPLDLDKEEPDDSPLEIDSDEEEPGTAALLNDQAVPSSPKKRAPSNYDPTQLEKIWILESVLKLGVPLMVEDWQESMRKPAFLRRRGEASAAGKVQRTRASKAKQSEKSTPINTISRYGSIQKAGSRLVQNSGLEKSQADGTSLEKPSPPRPILSSILPPNEQNGPRAKARSISPTPNRKKTAVIDLVSSPVLPTPVTAVMSDILEPELPPTVTKRRRNGGLTRSATVPMSIEASQNNQSPLQSREQQAFKFVQDRNVAPSWAQSDGTTLKRAKTSRANINHIRPSTPPQLSPIHKSVEPVLSCLELNGTTIECLDLTASPTAKQPPPTTITEWIRRSQSITPQKAKSNASTVYRKNAPAKSRTDNQTRELSCIQEYNLSKNNTVWCDEAAAPVLDLTASSPIRQSPTKISELMAPISSPRRLAQVFIRDDDMPANEPNSPITISNGAQVSINPIQRQLPRVSPEAAKPLIAESRKTKKGFRIRESLQGTWDYTEISIETSHLESDRPSTSSNSNQYTTGSRRKANGKTVFRMSEVVVLDMTDD